MDPKWKTPMATVMGVLAIPVAALLLSRVHGVHDEQSADEQAASVAAEGVALIAFIWVAIEVVGLNDVFRERSDPKRIALQGNVG